MDCLGLDSNASAWRRAMFVPTPQGVLGLKGPNRSAQGKFAAGERSPGLGVAQRPSTQHPERVRQAAGTTPNMRFTSKSISNAADVFAGASCTLSECGPIY